MVRDQGHHSPTGAFTLVELLIAATLGAMLLIVSAQSAGLFASTVAALEEDSVDDLDRALARISRDARYAWWIDVPTVGQLRVADADGSVWRYELDGTDLVVRNPSGETGVLASGIASISFETAASMRRFREGSMGSSSGTLTQVAKPSTGLLTEVLGNTGQIGISFMLNENVGEGSVTDVDEQLVYAVPETIGIGVATAAGFTGTLTVTLYESAAWGDARIRRGTTSMGSESIVLSILPVTAPDLDALPVGVIGGVMGTIICTDGVESAIRGSEVLTALSNGSTLGPCGFRRNDIFAVPVVDSTLNLSLPSVRLYPGVGYTLMVSVDGTGSLSVFTAEAKPAATWDTVIARTGSSALAPLDMSIPFTLNGTMLTTSTEEAEVTTSVSVTAVPAAGSSRSASVSVYSQVMAPDPWMGVVPGEVPPASP